ncbi:unnamed protein product [Somion occarium]|uniref:N-acetyltransferase domain-containing protein n=1 Tax=Somion occarium TaxID=3059160 RepID=A0ABP1DY78_9APHY
MFTTERLRLRAYKESDLDDIVDSVTEYRVQLVTSIGYTVPQGPQFKQEFKESLEKALTTIVIEKKDTKEFIGFLHIMLADSKNQNGEIGINLASAHWDKGYGTETMRFIVDYAFRGLGLRRVSLGVFGGNERAMKVYERIGFVVEATKRKCNWVEGEWRDIIFMGMLEEEWRARKEVEGTN